MKAIKRVNSSEVKANDAVPTDKRIEKNVVDQAGTSSHDIKASKTKEPKNILMCKPKIFAVNSKEKHEDSSKTIVSDQIVGMRACSSANLSPLDEFGGDLKIICSRLFNATVERVFKHQMDEVEQSNLPSIEPSLAQRIATDSISTDEEDNCVSPKVNKISSTSGELENNEKLDQIEEQNDSSLISQSKIFSKKLQFYCKSALNKSFDSIGMYRKSALLKKFLIFNYFIF